MRQNVMRSILGEFINVFRMLAELAKPFHVAILIPVSISTSRIVVVRNHYRVEALLDFWEH